MTKYRCFGCYKTTGKLCAPHAANLDKMEPIPMPMRMCNGRNQELIDEGFFEPDENGCVKMIMDGGPSCAICLEHGAYACESMEKRDD